VRVTTPVTETAITPADKFTYAIKPTVTEVSPKAGSELGGTEVTITGTNFTGGSTVHFGSNSASGVKVNSPESITAFSPPGAGTLNVIVTNAGGTSKASSADLFTYLPAPVVAAVKPKEGPGVGGTTVTITGKNFHEGATVKFGSTSSAKVAFISETELTAESPSGTGVVDVTVTTAGGTSATEPADQFTYLPAPAVTEVNPKEGKEAGGETVTITGKNFHEGATVKFGLTSSAKVTFVSETEITAESPSGTGVVHVTVTTADGTSTTSSADEFTYHP
jgi:hypothetical protein